MDLEFAMNKIIALAGTKFDPVVVDALDRAVRAKKIRLTARPRRGLALTFPLRFRSKSIFGRLLARLTRSEFNTENAEKSHKWHRGLVEHTEVAEIGRPILCGPL